MEQKKTIIDSHVHCGIQDSFPCQALENYLEAISGTQITGAAMFPPVFEIYDRHNPDFEDTPYWRERRRRANEYLTRLKDAPIQIIPYFFIWNDFATDQITEQHKGIKWHRHKDEPVYHYNTRECRLAVEKIRELLMPVVYEEELENTIEFIFSIAKGVRVIIPHLGGLNGSYYALKRNSVWENPMVYTDTALAAPAEIKDYIKEYGTGRILFGSDFPFGDPKLELSKILKLELKPEDENAILSENLTSLLRESNP
ncbi:MAG: amidohydrolase family protein [Desulfobacteraceae bacterium]